MPYYKNHYFERGIFMSEITYAEMNDIMIELIDEKSKDVASKKQLLNDLKAIAKEEIIFKTSFCGGLSTVCDMLEKDLSVLEQKLDKSISKRPLLILVKNSIEELKELPFKEDAFLCVNYGMADNEFSIRNYEDGMLYYEFGPQKIKSI
jgi:hypothetical protein